MTSLCELILQTVLISTLQEPWSKFSMNLDTQIEHQLSNLILCHQFSVYLDSQLCTLYFRTRFSATLKTLRSLPLCVHEFGLCNNPLEVWRKISGSSLTRIFIHSTSIGSKSQTHVFARNTIQESESGYGFFENRSTSHF